jgi:hypothetical protein
MAVEQSAVVCINKSGENTYIYAHTLWLHACVVCLSVLFCSHTHTHTYSTTHTHTTHIHTLFTLMVLRTFLYRILCLFFKQISSSHLLLSWCTCSSACAHSSHAHAVVLDVMLPMCAHIRRAEFYVLRPTHRHKQTFVYYVYIKCTHNSAFTRTCILTCMLPPTNEHAHTRTHTYMHTHIHACMHTETCQHAILVDRLSQQ